MVQPSEEMDVDTSSTVVLQNEKMAEISNSAAVKAPANKTLNDDEDQFADDGILDEEIQGAVHGETLLLYYRHMLPFRELFLWLNHRQSAQKDFLNREFAFTLANNAYLRYLAFTDDEAMRAETLHMLPSRFEIGPVYSANPKDRKSLRKAAFKPLEKELVFDIDLTDYDDVRVCCSKANICVKCWSFIRVACKVIDAALRQDFGFQHILWVYSGRRGIHAWVCDKRARQLNDQERRAIAGYFNIGRGSAQNSRLNDIKRRFHPSLTYVVTY